MNRLTAIARNFVKEEEGAALLEYGMLVLLIAVLCIVAIKTIGSKISNGFNSVNTQPPVGGGRYRWKLACSRVPRRSSPGVSCWSASWELLACRTCGRG